MRINFDDSKNLVKRGLKAYVVYHLGAIPRQVTRLRSLIGGHLLLGSRSVINYNVVDLTIFITTFYIVELDFE